MNHIFNILIDEFTIVLIYSHLLFNLITIKNIYKSNKMKNTGTRPLFRFDDDEDYDIPKVEYQDESDEYFEGGDSVGVDPSRR